MEIYIPTAQNLEPFVWEIISTLQKITQLTKNKYQYLKEADNVSMIIYFCIVIAKSITSLCDVYDSFYRLRFNNVIPIDT